MIEQIVMALLLKLNYPFAVLNDKTVDWQQVNPELFLKRLSAPSRTVELKMGMTLYILDSLGIRFWTKNGKVTQAQAVLVKEGKDFEDPKFPESTFDGQIQLNDTPIAQPLLLEHIRGQEGVRVEKDTDSLQYGLNIYYLFVRDKKYTLWVDKEDRQVLSVYF